MLRWLANQDPERFDFKFLLRVQCLGPWAPVHQYGEAPPAMNFRLILIFVFLWLIRLLYKAFREGTSLSAKKESSKEISGGRMVRDEICGTYIPVKGAIRERTGSDSHYFCSTECRDQFMSGLKKAAK